MPLLPGILNAVAVENKSNRSDEMGRKMMRRQCADHDDGYDDNGDREIDRSIGKINSTTMRQLITSPLSQRLAIAPRAATCAIYRSRTRHSCSIFLHFFHFFSAPHYPHIPLQSSVGLWNHVFFSIFFNLTISA